jgi:hypothetical protein
LDAVGAVGPIEVDGFRCSGECPALVTLVTADGAEREAEVEKPARQVGLMRWVVDGEVSPVGNRSIWPELG